jgi:hypothetical protein
VGFKVELVEQIRRDRELLGLSQRALIAKYRVHRRTVLQALEPAVPPARKRPQGRPAPKLGDYRELIDEWLIADLVAPRKQRHTAKRIWKRLVDEHGVEVAETTVRDRMTSPCWMWPTAPRMNGALFISRFSRFRSDEMMRGGERRRRFRLVARAGSPRSLPLWVFDASKRSDRVARAGARHPARWYRGRPAEAIRGSACRRGRR